MVNELLTLVLGGGTGFLGSLFGRVAGYFEQKQKIKEKKLDYEHELKLYELQAKERSADRESEERMLESVEDTKALGVSFQHDSSYGNSWLRWVRPALTFMLMLMTGLVYIDTQDLSIKAEIVSQVLFMASLSLGWWFADRSGKSSK